VTARISLIPGKARGHRGCEKKIFAGPELDGQEQKISSRSCARRSSVEERLELLGEALETFRVEAASGGMENTSDGERKKRFKSINRNQLMIRPVNVEKLVEEDHPARAIWAMVCELDWTGFEEEVKVVEGGQGRSGHDPRLLAALWIYAYSQGINSARELSRMCSYEPGCQWLTGLEEVNHHTLSDFRTRDKEGQDELFKQVLGVLSAEGLTDLKRVSRWNKNSSASFQ